MFLRSTLTLAAVVLLSSCGKPATPAASTDRFAGLDAQIKTWREDILVNHQLCTGKTGEMACKEFEVACKGERPITAAETAKGVKAKIVAAMTFAGHDAGASDTKPGSAFAEFTRIGDVWTRGETGPVNLSSCATF